MFFKKGGPFFVKLITVCLECVMDRDMIDIVFLLEFDGFFKKASPLKVGSPP